MNKYDFTLKDAVKDNTTEFSFYRQKYIYYKINIRGQWYEFPIDIDDLGTATLTNPCKAITLMRYIRKAMDNNMLTKMV